MDSGMSDGVLGVLLLLVGVVLLFWGGAALRVLIALFGAWVGFFLGAELVQAQVGGPLFGTFWGWVAAVVGAIVVGLIAYLWYWFGVVIGVAAMGYVVGVVTAGLFGADTGWVPTTVGLVFAALLTILAVVTHFPALLLVLASAYAGAGLVVTAVMLFTGEVDGRQLERAWTIADPTWLWYGATIVLFVIGLLVQLGSTSRRQQSPVGG
ncbi:DUF4203 domain-containing protein [Mumia zhuanghuii]|uniref:DUF4203 domain-containing protein n=2 Tax=Mumia TaxID=1546255 RepID=A0ABW1QJD5_9ACTN|nr:MULTISPECIES: DUF4203 domain-containing protein [Mumia]KAA1425400.1 DUF4203 domain-containing protein [Mumia zhuanghuii]